MKRSHLALIALALALVAAPARPAAAADQKPHIDMVFCIDCSGSMGPVIDTAKRKVWAIVNEIAKAKPAPVLRIGLIGYGNAMGPFRTFPLSDDLDDVYKNLMTFKDEGWGDEYVGLAVHRATIDMKWSDSKQLLKVIYVVGNETARQGPEDYDYTRTTPAAIKAGITVNAVYCGNAGGQDTWQQMARMADGQYLAIAESGGAVAIATPYDKDLDALSTKINSTYLAFGNEGRLRQHNQMAQDSNARTAGGHASSADRALAKSSLQYNNRLWDLVDASKEKDFDWTKLKEDQLPPEMKKMSLAERKAYVAKKTAERKAIQEQIKDLSAKRETYIQAEMKKKGQSGDKALDAAVRKTVVEQAQKKGFRF